MTATTIWARTATALTSLSVPMGAGAYIVVTGADLPDLYLVYLLIDLMPEQHADDEETLRSSLVQISIYNRAGLQSLPDVIGAMTAADFTFVAGRQLDYEPETGHYGIAFDFEYLEQV